MSVLWYLDKICYSDKAALVEHLQEQEIYENTLNIPHPYTEQDAKNWIDFLSNEYVVNNSRSVVFAIRRKTDHYLIGTIGFGGFRIGGKTKTAEIGYWLAKCYRNQGIMTNAVKKVCQIGFEELGLVRIIGRVFSFNPRSARVLEKAGFVQEGYLRKCESKNGEYQDVKLYAFINSNIIPPKCESFTSIPTHLNTN